MPQDDGAYSALGDRSTPPVAAAAYGVVSPTYGAAPPRPASGSSSGQYDRLDAGLRGAGPPAQAVYDDAYAPAGNSDADGSGAAAVPGQHKTVGQPGGGGGGQAVLHAIPLDSNV